MASNSAILDKQILDIEECVQSLKKEFEESGLPISDDSTTFNRFCVKLEFLLQTEQKEKLNLLGTRKDYWDYFCKCLATKRHVHDGLKFVKSISEFRTSSGRGRAFLRFCLANQCLADTLQQCFQNGKITSDFYRDGSPFMHFEQSSRLVAVLYELNEIQFELSPQGTNLDMGWPTFSRKVFGGAAVSTWNPPSRTLSMTSLFSLSSQQQDLSQSFGRSFTDEHSLPESQEVQSSDIGSAIQGIVTKMEELNANQCEANELTKELALNASRQLSSNFPNRMRSESELVDDVNQTEKREADLRQRLVEMERAADEQARQLEVVAERHADREQSFRDREREMEVQVQALERRNVDLVEQMRGMRSNKTEAEMEMETETETSDKATQMEEGAAGAQAMSEEKEAKYKKALVTLKEKLEIKDRVSGHLERQVAALKEVSAAVKSMLDVRTSEVQSLRTIVSELKAAHAGAPSSSSEEGRRADELEAEKVALEKRIAEMELNAENQRRDRETASALLRQREVESETMRDRVAALEANSVESERAMAALNERLTATATDRDSFKRQLETVTNLLRRMETTEEDLEKMDGEVGEVSEETGTEAAIVDGDRPTPVGSDDVEPGVDSRADFVVHSVVVLDDFPLARRAIGRLQRLLVDKRSPSVLPICRVHKHECQLGSVTRELRATKSLVEKLSNAHKRLQTSDAILRYELREKRVFVERMKEQLESAANMRQRVRQKHSESEIEWQSLRAEFASRHKQDSEESSGRGSADAAVTASTSSSADISREKSEERDSSVDGASCSSVSSSSAVIYSSVSPDLPATTSETEEDERVPDVTTHRRPADVRLELMEEQCRLLYCSLLSSMKKSEVLHYKLSKLHDNHSGGTPRSETATPPDVDGDRPVTTPPLSPTVDEPSCRDSLSDGNGQEDFSAHGSPSLDDSVDALKMDEEVDGIKIEIDVDSLKINDGKLVAKLDALLVAQSLPKRVEVLRHKKEDLEREVVRLNEDRDDGLVREARLRARLEKAGAAASVRESLVGQLEAERDSLKMAQVELGEELQRQSAEFEQQLARALAGREEAVAELQSCLNSERASWSSAKAELEAKLKEQTDCSERLLVELNTDRAQREESAELLQKRLTSERESWSASFEELRQQNDGLSQKLAETEARLANELTNRDKSVTELRANLERAAEELKQVRDTMLQEVAALRFQMSTESMRHDAVIKRHAECETEIGEVRERLIQQEQLTAEKENQLESAETERRLEKVRLDAALDQLGLSLATVEQELSEKQELLVDATRKLDEASRVNEGLVLSLDSSRAEIQRLSGDADELRSTSDEMREKIIKLIKEKDQLWRRGEQLSFIRKVQSSDRWIKDEEVSHCTNCNAEFSIVVRKHHCRICGRIFCFGCCNHWATTAAHSGRVRVCNDCVVGYSQVDPSLGESDDEEETTSATSNDPGSPVAAGPSSNREDDSSAAISLKSASNDSGLFDSPGDDSSTVAQESASLLGRLLASWTSPRSIAAPDEAEEDFHVVGDDEITKSLSHSGPYTLKADGEDSVVHVCPLMSVEELESEFCDGVAREVWINAGKAYGIPVAVKGRVTLLWEFSTEPKNIAFSLVYHFTECPEDLSEASVSGYLSGCPTRVLVPVTHCDSHLHTVRGKLVVRNPGIYTFYFGNDFSRFTSKKLKFLAQIQRIEAPTIYQNSDSTSPSSSPEQDSPKNEISG